VEIVSFGNHDTREVWIAYLPHAMHIADLAELYESEGRMLLLERIGRCELMLGRYKIAEQAYRQVVERRKGVLGEEHPDMLTSMNNLAQALSKQGKHAEAEQMHRETLALREKVLRKEHPDTLMSVYGLAYLLHHQNKYEDALPLYERACTGFQVTLGPDHPTTRACLEHYTSVQQ
jgi:tetratricopeptide (TPR) repeat protein